MNDRNKVIREILKKSKERAQNLVADNQAKATEEAKACERWEALKRDGLLGGCDTCGEAARGKRGVFRCDKSQYGWRRAHFRDGVFHKGTKPCPCWCAVFEPYEWWLAMKEGRLG